jgi:hypothetical protein
MDEKQKALFDACMRQADYFAGRWDCRKMYEWKTTIAIWALLAGGIYVKKPRSLTVELELAAVMLVLLIGYIRFWLIPVWNANNWEKQAGRFYRDQADSIMRGAERIAPLEEAWTVPPGRQAASFWRDWSMLFQMLSVLMLGVIYFIVPGGSK